MIVSDIKQQRETEMITKFFERFGTIKVPKCYKCQAPVEKFEVNANPELNTISFSAYCHDDKETLRLNFQKVMALPKEIDGVASAYAFYKPTTLIYGEKLII